MTLNRPFVCFIALYGLSLIKYVRKSTSADHIVSMAMLKYLPKDNHTET